MINIHDASHFAVTSNPIVWRVVGHIHDYLNGCSYHVWIHQVRVSSLHELNIPKNRGVRSLKREKK